MYLSSDTVILCTHGGRLVQNERLFIKRGKQKFLTRESVMNGRIDDCPKNCQRVVELINGFESEELKAPLLRNLDFLTDSSPAGHAVILEEPPAKTPSRARAILLTSIIWLCIGLAAVLLTISYYENRHTAYQAKVLDECNRQMETLASELTKR